MTTYTQKAREHRDEYADRVRGLAGQGMSIVAISRAIDRSSRFVDRVLKENGISVETRQAHSVSSTGPRQPALPSPSWVDIQPVDRRETAPRGRSYMVSRPVTTLERIERAAWKVGA